TCTAVADELQQPVLQWRANSLRFHRAHVAGRLDDAERCNDDSGRRSVELGEPDVETWYQGLRAVLRMFQGRTEEAAALIDVVLERFRGAAGYEAMGAWIHAEAGREKEARETLARLRVQRAGIIPQE